jgi:hypothetical protein
MATGAVSPNPEGHLWKFHTIKENSCIAIGAAGSTARILTMGSRKPHSWLLTPMIEGIASNVFLDNSSRGSSGKKTPSTTRVKEFVFCNKEEKKNQQTSVQNSHPQILAMQSQSS